MYTGWDKQHFRSPGSFSLFSDKQTRSVSKNPESPLRFHRFSPLTLPPALVSSIIEVFLPLYLSISAISLSVHLLDKSAALSFCQYSFDPPRYREIYTRRNRRMFTRCNIYFCINDNVTKEMVHTVSLRDRSLGK